jgi:hypothetical protein
LAVFSWRSKFVDWNIALKFSVGFGKWKNEWSQANKDAVEFMEIFFVSVITLNGNKSRGSGWKFQILPLQQTIYDTPAKEMDNPICDEKQVDDCYQSLVQM